jgi:hypothetical protein
MRVVRNAAPVAFVIVASLCISSVVSAKIAAPDKVYTDFGYVQVDPLDVEAAIAEGKAAQEAARRLLLLPSLHFAIIEEGSGSDRWGSVSDGYIVYPWPFPNGSRRLTARPATHVLRHEIGHDLLERYVVPKSSKSQYGTDAPDWLDEMAAVAFEGAEQQSNRRRTARREAARAGLLPLSQLLSMEHPEFKSKVAVDPTQVIATMEPTSSDAIRFYSTVQAFYDFLLARVRNTAIVAELTGAYMRGDDLKMWVINKLRSGREVGSLEKVDADFLRWLATDPRYAG